MELALIGKQRRWVAALAACLVVGCGDAGGGPEPDPPSSMPEVSSSEAEVVETPSPSPTPTPVEPLFDHAGMAELGFTEPTLSLRAAEWHVFSDALVHTTDAEAEVVELVEVGFDGVERWRASLPRPEGAQCLQLGADNGLEVVTWWFSDAQGCEVQGLNQLRPVVGGLGWKAIGEDAEGDFDLIEEGAEPYTSSMMAGFHHLPGGEGDSEWFVHLGPDLEEMRVERADLVDDYSVYGSWGGQYWGWSEDSDGVSTIRAGGDRLLQVGYGGHSFFGMPWFWYVATTNGLVQIRGEGFERLTAASNACAADGYLAVGAGLAAKGRLLIDYAQDSSRCIDQVPEGHVIEEVGPDGWLVIGPAPDDRESSTEASPRQLVHVDGGEPVDLPDGASPGFYDEHVLFSDGEGEGAVFTVFPLEQFDPEGV